MSNDIEELMKLIDDYMSVAFLSDMQPVKAREKIKAFVAALSQPQKENERLREVAMTLLDYAYDLIGEWSWKKGERAGNAEEYEKLDKDIKDAREALKKGE